MRSLRRLGEWLFAEPFPGAYGSRGLYGGLSAMLLVLFAVAACASVPQETNAPAPTSPQAQAPDVIIYEDKARGNVCYIHHWGGAAMSCVHVGTGVDSAIPTLPPP